MKYLNTWYGALFAIPVLVTLGFAAFGLIGLIIKGYGALICGSCL